MASLSPCSSTVPSHIFRAPVFLLQLQHNTGIVYRCVRVRACVYTVLVPNAKLHICCISTGVPHVRIMCEWMCVYVWWGASLFPLTASLSLYHLPHYSPLAQSLFFPLPPLSCRLFCLWHLLHPSLLVPRTSKTRACGILPSLLLCLPPTPLLSLPHPPSSRPTPAVFLQALFTSISVLTSKCLRSTSTQLSSSAKQVPPPPTTTNLRTQLPLLLIR